MGPPWIWEDVEMIFKDYYKILGLETSKVTPQEIKVAYREAAKKYHPDINIEDKFAEERFKDVNEAYKVLSDSSAKRKYDRMWNSNVGKKKYEESTRESGSRFSDFFHLFFGNIEQEEKQTPKKRKEAIRGENIETEIELSIEETFYGCEKKISLRTAEGKMKTFSVKVPAGIRNHEKIRLLGQGKTGINGGKNGDLFIKVAIQNDKRFVLSGIDLYTDLCLTPWEAALGTRATINTIDDTASIYIPQGIESGEKVRIAGKGYKDGKGGRGDLIAEVKIMVPKQLEPEEKQLYEKLSSISSFNPRREMRQR